MYFTSKNMDESELIFLARQCCHTNNKGVNGRLYIMIMTGAKYFRRLHPLSRIRNETTIEYHLNQYHGNCICFNQFWQLRGNLSIWQIYFQENTFATLSVRLKLDKSFLRRRMWYTAIDENHELYNKEIILILQIWM